MSMYGDFLTDRRKEKNEEMARQMLHACASGDLNLIKSYSSIPNIFEMCDSKGKTPLLASISSKNTEIASYILDQKRVNVNQCNINGNTALHFACYWGLESIVNQLLQFPEIDPTIRNKNGESPGDVASKRNNTELHAKIDAFLDGEGLQLYCAAFSHFSDSPRNAHISSLKAINPPHTSVKNASQAFCSTEAKSLPHTSFLKGQGTYISADKNETSGYAQTQPQIEMESLELKNVPHSITLFLDAKNSCQKKIPTIDAHTACTKHSVSEHQNKDVPEYMVMIAEMKKILNSDGEHATQQKDVGKEPRLKFLGLKTEQIKGDIITKSPSGENSENVADPKKIQQEDKMCNVTVKDKEICFQGKHRIDDWLKDDDLQKIADPRNLSMEEAAMILKNLGVVTEEEIEGMKRWDRINMILQKCTRGKGAECAMKRDGTDFLTTAQTHPSDTKCECEATSDKYEKITNPYKPSPKGESTNIRTSDIGNYFVFQGKTHEIKANDCDNFSSICNPPRDGESNEIKSGDADDGDWVFL